MASGDVLARLADDTRGGIEPPPRPRHATVATALEEERARWFYWVPVLLGAGIAIYFALPFEPASAVVPLPLAAGLALRLSLRSRPLAVVAADVVLLAGIGFALVALRTAMVAAPVIETRLGPVEVRGHVELVEAREGGGERLTLRTSSVAGLDDGRRPQRVRITSTSRLAGVQPGDAIVATATLMPPSAPTLPGDYDFARQAFFQGLGAVGYASKPIERDAAAAAPDGLLGLWARIARLRQAIGARVTAAVPGETGAIAAALITGERGAISDETNDVYRDSGLFHILSISGLHMAIMGGAVFFSVRFLLALVPALALRYPIKKWAAVAALAGSLAYLAISGGAFATVRSFLTISIMFLAILWNRPAVALRNVALSALLILLLFPESLLDAGFQMSFAAVTALVAAYELVRERHVARGRPPVGHAMRIALFFGGIVLSTIVASVAVAPFAIYHFHKSQQLAVIANLIAVPLCNLVVMPAALAALVTMPLGLEAWPLTVMGWGIDGMTWAARLVAGLPGAVTRVAAIPTASFALVVAGGLWLMLWHARWRIAGLAVIAAGVALAPAGSRPDILVGRDGQLVAVRGSDGRIGALAVPRSMFELQRWLEHDGDARDGRVAALAPGAGANGVRCDAVGCTARVKGLTVAIPKHPAAVAEDCRRADVLVVAAAGPRACHHPLLVIDRTAVRARGTHAIYVSMAGAAGRPVLRVETVAGARGERPWSPRARGLDALETREAEMALAGWREEPRRPPSRLDAIAAGAALLEIRSDPASDGAAGPATAPAETGPVSSNAPPKAGTR